MWEAKIFANNADFPGRRFSLVAIVFVYNRLESVALVVIHKNSSIWHDILKTNTAEIAPAVPSACRIHRVLKYQGYAKSANQLRTCPPRISQGTRRMLR